LLKPRFTGNPATKRSVSRFAVSCGVRERRVVCEPLKNPRPGGLTFCDGQKPPRSAAEGTRLLDFKVKAQCTPSRSAFITGRFSIRFGFTWHTSLLLSLPRGRLATKVALHLGNWQKWHFALCSC
jgi:hypothetical protein